MPTLEREMKWMSQDNIVENQVEGVNPETEPDPASPAATLFPSATTAVETVENASAWVRVASRDRRKSHIEEDTKFHDASSPSLGSEAFEDDSPPTLPGVSTFENKLLGHVWGGSAGMACSLVVKDPAAAVLTLLSGHMERLAPSIRKFGKNIITSMHSFVAAFDEKSPRIETLALVAATKRGTAFSEAIEAVVVEFQADEPIHDIAIIAYIIDKLARHHKSKMRAQIIDIVSE